MRTVGISRHVEPVRIGLLGCSSIARRKVFPALATSERATLAVVASRTPEAVATRLGEYGSYAICSYEELLERTDLDLVYLSLPNHLHETWTIRALEQGKHVLCEKPLGLSPAAVERMYAKAGEQNRLLYENLMFLHHPQHAAVRALIASGRIGRLTTLRCVFGFPLPAAGNYRLDPACGGGAFFDLARYPLGMAQYLLHGELAEFRGFACDRDGLNLAMHGVARSSREEILEFSIAFGQSYESYYEVVGERGKIRVDRAFTTPAELANRIEVIVDGQDVSFTVPAADHFRLMLDHVCALVRGGGDFREPAQRSRQLARLAEQMARGCRHE